MSPRPIICTGPWWKRRRARASTSSAKNRWRPPWRTRRRWSSPARKTGCVTRRLLTSGSRRATAACGNWAREGRLGRNHRRPGALRLLDARRLVAALRRKARTTTGGLTPARAGGGAFIDLAPHGLDLVQVLLGEPLVETRCLLQRRVFDYPVDDGAALVGRFRVGRAAVAERGLQLPGPFSPPHVGTDRHPRDGHRPGHDGTNPGRFPTAGGRRHRGRRKRWPSRPTRTFRLSPPGSKPFRAACGRVSRSPTRPNTISTPCACSPRRCRVEPRASTAVSLSPYVCTNCGFWQRKFRPCPRVVPVCLDFRHTPAENGFEFWSAEEAAESGSPPSGARTRTGR